MKFWTFINSKLLYALRFQILSIFLHLVIKYNSARDRILFSFYWNFWENIGSTNWNRTSKYSAWNLNIMFINITAFQNFRNYSYITRVLFDLFKYTTLYMYFRILNEITFSIFYLPIKQNVTLINFLILNKARKHSIVL